MTLKRRLLSGGAALAALAQSACGQPASPWRVFRVADGLPESACESVVVSAQGTVVVRHLNASSVTKLDGYGASVIVAPPSGMARVHESPAGQLWASTFGGLQEFKGNQWIFHRLPEIAAELRASISSPPGNLPVCPVRQGRVLFLLRDRLMALDTEDAEYVTTETLRLTSQTRLVEFLGLTPSRDGGLWVSGAQGLAKLPAPARNLKANSEWQEFTLPSSPAIKNLREPRGDELGGVTMVADAVGSGNQVIAHFDGQRWTVREVGLEHIRLAWRGPEQNCWAVIGDTLFIQEVNQVGMVPNDEISVRKFFDVATEAGGPFWLATSDGLFRYAPPVWRTPAPAQSFRGSVFAIAEDREGRIWFTSGGDLHLLLENELKSFPISGRLRRLPQVRPLMPLATGELLLLGEEELLRFHPDSGVFDHLASDTNQDRFKLLGLLAGGVPCFQRSNEAAAEPTYELVTYDGKEFKPLTTVSPPATIGGTLITLFQTRGGDLWLAGDQGVACLHDDGWEIFSVGSHTGPEEATSFAETADSRIWCATTDKLWVFDGRDWALTRSGFERINAMVHARDDSLWLASNSGLHHLTPAGWIEHGIDEGLSSVAVRSAFQDHKGRLWVGTSQGVNLYHPEADPDPPKTDIVAPINTRIPEGGAVTLTFHGQDKWKFTPRTRLLYSHRLDDRDWSPFLEQNTIFLAELPAGKHYFQVRAMDRNGNIESKPAQFTFDVALPWYREARLVGIAGVGLVVAVFFVALAFNRHRQLVRSYARMEKEVAERTRELELAGRELLHSQKMNALGTLAAGIAHDFNNILSIVKGSAQIIEDNLENRQKVQTRVDRIKTVVEQGAGIVRAMLGFSRSSDGSATVCDLNSAVRDTIALLGDRFLREVQVEFEATPGLPNVAVTKDLVQQILLNFIFNAAESMKDRKRVLLRTRLLEKLPDGLVLKPAEATGYISISVQDTGCGIDPETLPRIFEPFFTTKALSTHRGTGLGLSMAYELAKQLAAGLAVESVVGKGSIFTLVLSLPKTTPVFAAGADTNTTELSP